MFGSLSIRAKTLSSFAASLTVACGLQWVLLWQFGAISELTRYLVSNVVPGVTVSGHLDYTIGSVRIFDAQYLMTNDPAIRAETAGSLSRAKKTITADLEKLRNTAETLEERQILVALHEELPKAFQTSDLLIAFAHAHRIRDAQDVFTGPLNDRFSRIDQLIDRFVAIKNAQGEEASRKSTQTKYRSIFVVVAVIVFSIAVTFTSFWAMVRIVTSPLNRITQAMGELAEGNLDTRVPATGRKDEIGRLAQAMTRFKASALELRGAKLEAEAGSRAKADFLANMSHELRTPLNAIIGFSNLMSSQLLGPLGNPRYREYIDDIHRSGLQLLALINDILDLSRLDAGKADLFEQEVSLTDMIADACRTTEVQAKLADVTVSIKLPADLPLIRGDERRIMQMVLNLLSNAIKFTPEAGTVTVSAKQSVHGLVLHVRDTGIGISKDDLPKVLERFAQVDGSLSRRHYGTGLGLPLVKQLIELHGGSLTLESEIGVGTTASILFPFDRVVRIKKRVVA